MTGVPRRAESGAIRFTDILTTAAAAADYRGESVVQPRHLLVAIDILSGISTMADLGRPTSPLVPRPRDGAVDARVRELVQRWFEALHGDVTATLNAEQLTALRGELAELESAT